MHELLMYGCMSGVFGSASQQYGLTSHLCRQKASLATDSSRDEQALNTYLFELVKAGRISEAATTCMECGQPWRAASLLGGGPFGPTPLGVYTAQSCAHCRAMTCLLQIAVLQISLFCKTAWTCRHIKYSLLITLAHLNVAT